MNVHQNARLTVSCRELLIRRVMAGRAKCQVAGELGISVQTVNKWLQRYRDAGWPGLQGRSSRPNFSPCATAQVVKNAVVALRRQRLTLVTIAAQLGISRSTVARIAQAAGLNRLSKLEPIPVYRRYERAEPGELLHLDVKKLGRIVKMGHRITGDLRDRTYDAGCYYLLVAIDDASQLAYAQILPGEGVDCCIPFLRAAVAYYAGLGVRIKGVYTDNAKAYRGTQFSEACQQLGLTHHYTRPYTPRTNGKAEPFIQTSLRTWAYAGASPKSNQRRDPHPTRLTG
jgi:transposase InsO family protein